MAVMLSGCSKTNTIKVEYYSLPYSDQKVQEWIDEHRDNGIYISKVVENSQVNTVYLYLNSTKLSENKFIKYSNVSIGTSSDKNSIDITTENEKSDEAYEKLFKIALDDSKIENVIINGERIDISEITEIQ